MDSSVHVLKFLQSLFENISMLEVTETHAKASNSNYHDQNYFRNLRL